MHLLQMQHTILSLSSRYTIENNDFFGIIRSTGVEQFEIQNLVCIVLSLLLSLSIVYLKINCCFFSVLALVV